MVPPLRRPSYSTSGYSLGSRRSLRPPRRSGRRRFYRIFVILLPFALLGTRELTLKPSGRDLPSVTITTPAPSVKPLQARVVPRPTPRFSPGPIHSNAPLSLSRDWLRRHPPAQPPAIDGRAAIVIDLDRRQILYEQSATTRYPVGSLAKLMTGMVADDIAPPGLMVTVPQGATGAALDRQGLSAGEQLSVHDLLTGLLLVSANDAAETLARGMVARARFIELMNQKASLMRLRDSAFIDPGGVDDGASFSSAQDMAVILATLLRDYPDLRQILGTRQVQLVGAGHKPYDLINADRLLWTYPGAIGGKPAYSGAAGYCLAAAATRQGRTVLAVVLGSDQHFTDAGALLDFGFRHLSS